MSLPNEVWLRIFDYLDVLDLNACACVSTEWRELSCDPLIWRRLSFIIRGTLLRAYQGAESVLEFLRAGIQDKVLRNFDEYQGLAADSSSEWKLFYGLLLRTPIPRVLSFDELSIEKSVLRGIYSYGFEKPSALQATVLPIITAPHAPCAFVFGSSLTGKHAAVVISQIDRLLKVGPFAAITPPAADLQPSATAEVEGASTGAEESGVISEDVRCAADGKSLASTAGGGDRVLLLPQGLILTHSRELAHGLSHMLKQLAEFTPVTSRLVVGGVPMRDRIQHLQEMDRRPGVVLVGTPGVVLNLMLRGSVSLDRVVCVSVHDADDVLGKGYKDQVCELFGEMSANRPQAIMSSATRHADHVEELEAIGKILNPTWERVQYFNPEKTLDRVRQYYVDVDREEWKLDTFMDLYAHGICQGVVFCNTSRKAQWITNALLERDLPVSTAQTAHPRDVKDQALQSFRSGSTRVLVTNLSDEVDIVQVSCSVHWDIPINADAYVQRVGLAGRFGRSCSIMLIANDDVAALREIESFYTTRFEELPMDISF